MSKKPHQSFADYVTMALSPLLIMAMVGSLVFFLREVFQGGGHQFGSRLEWTLFWFVVGIVLIARISMHPAVGERAPLYGFFLFAAVYFAMLRFFSMDQYASPFAGWDWLINLVLMTICWWSAHKLTWDCTYIDDQVDASGQGLLEAAGLDENDERIDEAPEEEPGGTEHSVAPHENSFVAWMDRWKAYREAQKKKPHTPGVWVVYYSLAALPLFGLGQALIPAAAEERRRYAFKLLAIYVASGLGLLATTSFLGLRRYLRQRRLEMPKAMTGVWIGLGAGLILLLLILGMMLPRPNAEYSLFTLKTKDDSKLSASRYAMKTDSAGKGEGKASNDPKAKDDKAKPGSGQQRDKQGGQQTQGKSGESASQQKGSSQQKGGSQQKSGSQQNDGSKSGDQRGKQSADKSDKSDKSDNKSNDQSRSDNERRDEDKNKNQQAKQSKQKQKEEERQGGGPRTKEEEESRDSEKGAEKGQSSPSSTSEKIGNLLEKFSGLSTVLKWIVFAILAAVAIYFFLRSGLQWLANFTDWAKNLLEALRSFWANLFGSRPKEEGSEEEAGEEAPAEVHRPFAFYTNPFQDGSAERMSPDELARYSFEAFESWAWERKLGRQRDETPLEFAHRVGQEAPALETDAERMASLYARVAYAKGRLTSGSLGPMKQFWQRLEGVNEQPLST